MRALAKLAGFIALTVAMSSTLGMAEESVTSTPAVVENCEASLKPGFKEVSVAAANFQRFFTEIDNALFERKFFLEVSKLALLAKEHVLILGPPGNAKSMGVDIIMDNIIDETTKETSAFKIQMTPETSLSETHGVIDYKKITEENVQTRMWNQGLLSAKLVFIDEFFDARANAIRNNLMALNEREHAQGRERIQGITETGWAATNKYMNEVYEKAGDDGPKAVIDRFAFVAFVPGEMEGVDAATRLVTEFKSVRPTPLSFQDLDVLRAKVGEVKIPDYVAHMLTLAFMRMKAQTESLEESEKKRYLDQRKAGLTPMPPYRATKYYSPRTLRKAGKILRAIVLNDWIEKEGSRELVANSEDLERLVSFFTLNSVSDSFLNRLAESTVNPNEKIQVMTVVKEREMFQEIYREILTGVNSSTSVLTDIEVARESAVTPALKGELVNRMIAAYLEATMSGTKAHDLRDLTEADIASSYVESTLEGWLRDELGADFDREVAGKVKEIRAEKARVLEQARLDEVARLKREQKEAAQVARVRAQEEATRKLAAEKFEKIRALFADVKNNQIVTKTPLGGTLEPFLITKTGERSVEFFSVQAGVANLESLDLETGRVASHQTFEAVGDLSGLYSLVRLAEGKYLFWFGNYGRVWEAGSGKLEPAKVIYEVSAGQALSKNVANEKFWLVDPSGGTNWKIGKVSTVDLRNVEWFEASGFKFEQFRGQALKDFFDTDVISAAMAIRLIDADTAVGSIKNSSLGFPAFYKIDLKAKTVSAHLDHEPAFQISTSANQEALWSHRKMTTFNATPADNGDTILKIFNRPIVDGKDTPVQKIEVTIPAGSDLVDYLNAAVWDISPSGNFILTRQQSNLRGFDWVSKQWFDVLLPQEYGQVANVTFIDEHHVAVTYSMNVVIYRLPTAGH